jgi:hypothetical protein
MATFRTATEFVLAVENMLGWAAEETPTKPLWKVRQVEAGKINRKRKEDPELYSWENLEIERIAVKSPVGVLWKVQKALAERPREERPRPLGELIEEAVAHEQSQQRAGWQEWLISLQRAQGNYREDLLREWREAGRST